MHAVQAYLGLDVLLLQADIEEPHDLLKQTGQVDRGDFEPVLKNFKENLQTYTTKGRAYEIDFRLRPEGSHATEVVTLTQLNNYFASRVEAWERLAYTKNRIVYSSEGFTDYGMLDRFVFSDFFSVEDIEQIRKIRIRKEIEIGKEKV